MMGIRHRWRAIIVAVTVLLLGSTVAYASVDDFFRAALSGESIAESIPESNDNAADSEGSWDESIWGQWDAAKTSDKASDHMPTYADPEEEKLDRIREEQEKLLEEMPPEEPEEKNPKEEAKKPEKAKEQEPSAVGEPIEEKDNAAIDTIAAAEKTVLPTGRYVIIALLLAGAGGIGGYLLRHPARREEDDNTDQ